MSRNWKLFRNKCNEKTALDFGLSDIAAELVFFVGEKSHPKSQPISYVTHVV